MCKRKNGAGTNPIDVRVVLAAREDSPCRQRDGHSPTYSMTEPASFPQVSEERQEMGTLLLSIKIGIHTILTINTD